MQYLLKAGLFATVINVALTPFSSRFAAYFGYIAIVSFLLYPIAESLRIRSIKRSIFIIIFIIAVSAITSIEYLSSNDLQIKLISLFSFIAFYWTLSLPTDSQPTNNISFKDVSVAGYLMTAIFIVYAFGGLGIAYIPTGKYGDLVFTMGLGNPNGTAVYVLFTAMILLLIYKSASNKIHKIVLITLICGLACVLYLLSSRTVLFCFVLAVMFAVLLPKLRIKKIYRYIALIAPFLMIIIQFTFTDQIGDYTVLGKELNTGRLNLYRSLLNEFAAEPIRWIFGNICKYNFLNYHNSILSVLASLGSVGVIWMVSNWNAILKRIERCIAHPHQKLAYFFILLLLLDSVSESMTVIGTIPYSFFVCIMVKIARGDIVIGLETQGIKGSMEVHSKSVSKGE